MRNAELHFVVPKWSVMGPVDGALKRRLARIEGHPLRDDLVTGIANAFMDSVPLVAITGRPVATSAKPNPRFPLPAIIFALFHGHAHGGQHVAGLERRGGAGRPRGGTGGAFRAALSQALTSPGGVEMFETALSSKSAVTSKPPASTNHPIRRVATPVMRHSIL